MKIRFSILMLAVLAFAGCAKDKTVDDYNNDKLQQDLGKLQNAQGTYTGFLNKKSQGAAPSPVGSISIGLVPTTKNVPSQDSSKAIGQPVMQVTIEVQAASHMVIVAKDAVYQPENGHLTTFVDVTPSQGANETISLDGTISGNTFTGRIAVVGFEEYGGSFSLTRGGRKLADLAKELKTVTSKAVLTQSNYSGQTRFSQKGVDAAKPVSLTILKPDSKSEDDIISLLKPINLVVATFNYGNGATLSFNNATWDETANSLEGCLVLGSQGQTSSCTSATTTNPSSGTASTSIASTTVRLKCLTNGANGLTCGMKTSASQGDVAVSNLSPVSESSEIPADSSETRDAVDRVYAGTRVLDGGRVEPIHMTVTYPARTRAIEIVQLIFPDAERLLTVSWAYDRNGVSSNMGDSHTKWDIVNKRLEGTYTPPSSGTSPITLTLICPKFNFEMAPYNFTCKFTTSLMSKYVDLNFRQD